VPVRRHIELKNSETLSAAIVAARSEIKAVRDHLSAVRTAPLPPADQMQAGARRQGEHRHRSTIRSG
jgi:hypothetical protein